MCRQLLPRKGSCLFSARTKQRLRCMASSPDTTRSMNLRPAPSIKTAEESSRARLTSSCSNSASGLTNPTEHAQVRPSLAWGSAKNPSPPVVLEYWSHCRRADTRATGVSPLFAVAVSRRTNRGTIGPHHSMSSYSSYFRESEEYAAAARKQVDLARHVRQSSSRYLHVHNLSTGPLEGASPSPWCRGIFNILSLSISVNMRALEAIPGGPEEMWRGSLDDAIRYSTETEVSKRALKPAKGASGGTSVGV